MSADNPSTNVFGVVQNESEQVYMDDTIEINTDDSGEDQNESILVPIDTHARSVNTGNMNTDPLVPWPSSSSAYGETGLQLETGTRRNAPVSLPVDGPSVPQENHMYIKPNNNSSSFSQVENDSKKDDDEAECCPICFEPWTNSGEHRLISLKCGHLFGQSCIEKWLVGQGGKCPQCNSIAVKKDIRVIYAKALKMCDTAEKDKVMCDLEKEKYARKKAELESAETKLKFQLALDEVNRLQEELKRYKSVRSISDRTNESENRNTVTLSHASSGKQSFVFDKAIKISDNGGCRVMAGDCYQSVLCISQPSANQLFPGFGVKKLNTLDFKTSQFICMHSKAIRDLSFNLNSPNGYLLSCSLDKTVKVTSLQSNASVQTYTCTLPVWSCSWNINDGNYLYAGQQNGTVSVFDMRNTSQHIKQFNNHGSKSPVLSLQYVPSNETLFSTDGVLVGQLDRCTFYEKRGEEYKVHILPVEGSLTSFYFESSTYHTLATLRPNTRNPNVRHSLFKFVSQNVMDSALYSCTNVHTFLGGSTQKLLSKNKLIPDPNSNGNLLACACDESSQSVLIWDVTSGLLKQKLPSNFPVMDLCQIGNAQGTHMVTLTEKEAILYKWR